MTLEAVPAHDQRIGAELLSARQIGVSWGQTVSNAQLRIGAAGLKPVAVMSGSRAHLFLRSEVTGAGLLPDRPFDAVTEVRLSTLARERGQDPTHLLSALRNRVSRGNGRTGHSTDQELADAGVARKLGKLWVATRAVAEDLLRPPYDPAVEATLDDLLDEYGGFANPANLGSSMRGVVKTRSVLDTDGRTRIVANRKEAQEWLTARRPRRTPLATAALDEQPAWRSYVGPIKLATPSSLRNVDSATAAWLLGSQAHNPKRGARPSVPVAELERDLVTRGDFLGLALLARLLENRLLIEPGADRVRAIIAGREKAG